MKPNTRLLASLVGIIGLAALCVWLVIPQGGRISLKPLKIPFDKKFETKLGLDLQGGSHLIYQADFSHIAQADQAEAINAVRDTIERRVNAFGVAEPVVQSTGTDKVVVELPGIKDINAAIDQIGQTPFLEFKEENPTPTANIDANGKAVVDVNSQWKSTGLSGKQLDSAKADIQTGSRGSLGSGYIVRLKFNDEGKKLFSDITTRSVGKPIAIFLDGQILSAPTVQTPITDGEAIITGQFTAQQAKQLALRLNSGALPVPIKLISQENIGASLGKESVAKSVLAGIIGLLLVAIFMVLFYRLPGLLAVIALAIYTVLSFAIFKVGISPAAVALVGLFFFLGLTVNAKWGIMAFISYAGLMFLGAVSPVTLTLAGIAGFILSIGMAVDANILIFERLKEEIRSGKEVSRAIDDGFSRAWLSIRDSNISSLITVVILYLGSTSPSVKGFALTLGIGIVISMFTAISITRTFLKLFITKKLMSHPVLFGVSRRHLAQEGNK